MSNPPKIPGLGRSPSRPHPGHPQPIESAVRDEYDPSDPRLHPQAQSQFRPQQRVQPPTPSIPPVPTNPSIPHVSTVYTASLSASLSRVANGNQPVYEQRRLGGPGEGSWAFREMGEAEGLRELAEGSGEAGEQEQSGIGEEEGGDKDDAEDGSLFGDDDGGDKDKADADDGSLFEDEVPGDGNAGDERNFEHESEPAEERHSEHDSEPGEDDVNDSNPSHHSDEWQSENADPAINPLGDIPIPAQAPIPGDREQPATGSERLRPENADEDYEDESPVQISGRKGIPLLVPSESEEESEEEPEKRPTKSRKAPGSQEPQNSDDDDSDDSVPGRPPPGEIDPQSGSAAAEAENEAEHQTTSGETSPADVPNDDEIDGERPTTSGKTPPSNVPVSGSDDEVEEHTSHPTTGGKGLAGVPPDVSTSSSNASESPTRLRVGGKGVGPPASTAAVRPPSPARVATTCGKTVPGFVVVDEDDSDGDDDDDDEPVEGDDPVPDEFPETPEPQTPEPKTPEPQRSEPTPSAGPSPDSPFPSTTAPRAKAKARPSKRSSGDSFVGAEESPSAKRTKGSKAAPPASSEEPSAADSDEEDRPRKKAKVARARVQAPGKIQCAYMKLAKGSKPAAQCGNTFHPRADEGQFCHIVSHR